MSDLKHLQLRRTELPNLFINQPAYGHGDLPGQAGSSSAVPGATGTAALVTTRNSDRTAPRLRPVYAATTVAAARWRVQA